MPEGTFVVVLVALVTIGVAFVVIGVTCAAIGVACVAILGMGLRELSEDGVEGEIGDPRVYAFAAYWRKFLMGGLLW